MRASAYTTVDSIERQSVGWLKEIRKQVAPRPFLVPDPKRCALIVIDMNRYFSCPSGRCYLPASSAIRPSVAALIGAWRSFGGTVVFTRHAHLDREDCGMFERFYSDCIMEGTEGAELVEWLEPEPGEAVIRKNSYDAFWETRLEDHLRKQGLDQVMIAGVLTHLCCETTARSAFCRGFEVYLPVDAMASVSERRHVCALEAMADGVGVVMTSREAIEICGAKG